ncbi:MAG: glycosyltransferase family 2 protein [Phaeovulum sp.]|uniref:glycosyltransferase family 2 protein n=1 Tax=Phaeovulum sp. TaxID=2934796 RepID=UPI00273154C6|nr:glycosyltransferase family 2 protein [Phaeovulum sp.]MDP2063952.1 glycosyltransferase family 2 protein [Phaeovulum sp.]
MSDLIISLSTIPPRFPHIGQTLADLLALDADIAEIRLNIPKHYRRFPDVSAETLSGIPKGVRVVRVEEDLGPATKILPTVAELRGQDVEILYCDDDQHYDRPWARRFLKARAEQPDACIVERGYDFETRPKGSEYYIERQWFPRAKRRHKGLAYRAWRAATLCRKKLPVYTESGYVDVAEGFRGVMIRPGFIPDAAFDIPDILWTVDDPWLSGHMTRIGVPIWLFADAPHDRLPYEAHNHHRLGTYVYKDHGRLAADTRCIEYFRTTYGIWQDRKAGQRQPETAGYPDRAA